MSDQQQTIDWNQIWWTKEEAEATGLPILGQYKWRDERKPEARIVLSASRCAAFGVPVIENEMPVGFRYSTKGHQGKKCYTRLYDRTGRIDDETKLFEMETVEEEPADQRATTKEQRIEICNTIINEIAKRGRQFLHSKSKQQTASFEHDGKKLWYIDHYTGCNVYPYGKKHHNFSPGGTMRGLVNDMRMFIITGKKCNGVHGYGGLYGTSWGYPDEDMEAIQNLAIELGYMDDYSEEYQRHKERQGWQ